jgi:hypothetical protein
MKAGARTKSANIEVTYVGFTAEAQGAFESAVNIWESLLTSNVTIHVLARWAPLANGVLGGASSGGYIMNFDGAQRANVWYPVALAEKISRKDLNDPDDPDIIATFNSTNSSWHFGSANPPPGTHDLMSVVLHEIGHGLGITKTYEVSGGTGTIASFYNGRPVVYETNLEDASQKNLVTTFEAPSAALGTALTSSLVFYNSPLVRNVNGNQSASIYAPTTYSPGSSIAHLDEVTYPAGSSNSLMTPSIGAAERILDPGPIIMQILKDMGWVTTYIDHTPLRPTEDTTTPLTVTCKVTSDTSFDPATLSVNYSTDGTTFTSVVMTPTGTPTEFKATIPNGLAAKYHYFIKVTDGDQRIITEPGTSYIQNKTPTQTVFTFDVGPDLKDPFINHVPVQFMSTLDTLRIEAVISDNIGVLEAMIDWDINGTPQATLTLPLKPNTDSTYIREIIFPEGTLDDGDKIHYRITAKDKAIAGNTKSIPSASTFFEVNVTGLAAAQDSYLNDFNDLSDEDFFGNKFSISKPDGFDNGAIHSGHPYQQGDGAPNNTLNFIYNLRIPIRVKDKGATIKFDEIVLVEPGEPGAPFGSVDFYDYVVVEGSKDGGITWVPVADGYDSRDRAEWLNHYNSTMSGQNSTAQGTQALYRTRILDLLEEFVPGQVVAIRFRLFSDPFAVGWGWSIDNLAIQVDTDAPVILHQHVDHVMAGTTQFEVKSKITDDSGIERVMIEHKINTGSVTTSELIVNPAQDLFSLVLNFPALVAGDNLFYRIRAIDSIGNARVYPASDFLQVAAVSLASPVDAFVTDFSSTNDFAGNFFTVETKDGFQDAALHSAHSYPDRIGPDPATSTLTCIIRKPIKVSSSNDFITYDAVVLTEYIGNEPVDYVVVEGSKDGVTWEKLVPEHAANAVAKWKSQIDLEGSGNSSLFAKRLFRIRDTGKFAADDVILIRFRLTSNGTKTGWGLAIDNLSIQGITTGLPARLEQFSIYPNPVTGSTLNVRVSPGKNTEVSIRLMTAHGTTVGIESFIANNDVIDHPVDISNLPDGLYLISVATEKGNVTARFVKAQQ